MRMANPKTPPKVLKHLKEGFVDKDRYDVYVQRNSGPSVKAFDPLLECGGPVLDLWTPR